MLLLTVFRTGQARKETTITFTDFVDKVKEGQVKEVTISGSEVYGVYQSQDLAFATQIPPTYSSLYALLIERNVRVKMKDASSGGWVSFLVSASPFSVLIVVWVLIACAGVAIWRKLCRGRQYPGGADDSGNGALN